MIQKPPPLRAAKHTKAQHVEEREGKRLPTFVAEKSTEHKAKHIAKSHSTKHAASTCTPLVNHGTHFTVEIEVGTPGQKFDVVADTGSDAIIVPSCACVKAGYCNSKSRCFQGTNRSSTFAIEDGPHGPPTIRMMFGSGPVQAVVASDTVGVGKLHTKMDDGILLMTDQLLNIKGQFEGILGLGLPSTDAKKGLYRQASDAEQAAPAGTPAAPDSKKADSEYMAQDPLVESAGVGANGVNIFPFPASFTGSASESGSVGSLLAATEKPAKKADPTAKAANSSGLVVKGFMEEAGIDRFSMCFNDGENGVLRLGTPKAKSGHGSIGQVHWGLDFHGISVGNKWAPVKFCKPSERKKGQKTSCGAIPDSGTTAFMAPKEHLLSLYESICDRWDRCNKNYTAMTKAADAAKTAAIKEFNVDPFHIEPASKAVIFQQLVLDCQHWLSEGKGLDELPAIHFHIGGANGTKQTLNLFGWSYIIETNEKEYKYIYKKIPGLGKLPMGKNFTGHTHKVCSPAFSTMEYTTAENGPVWILGTPIFYEYQVGYDLAVKPPQISFSNSSCGACGKAKTSLISANTTTHKHRSHQSMRQPRKVNGPLRVARIDVNAPL